LAEPDGGNRGGTKSTHKEDGHDALGALEQAADRDGERQGQDGFANFTPMGGHGLPMVSETKGIAVGELPSAWTLPETSGSLTIAMSDPEDSTLQAAFSPYRLSKSRYLSGLQCLKRLWLEIHQPDLATEPDEAAQAILEMGATVGALARHRFPGGVLVEADYRHATDALARTRQLVDDHSVPAIFEGAFQSKGVLVRVDVLERLRDDGRAEGWRLIEVKSATKVKEVHLDDVAIQWRVLRDSGLPVEVAAVLHVNTQYLFPGGSLDLEKLFTLADITSQVQARSEEIPARLHAMRDMLDQPSPPNIEPNGHCHVPYDCPFWAYCTKIKPARWIYYLPGGERAIQSFVRRGIQTIDEIPDTDGLLPIQRLIKNNTEWRSDALKQVLESVVYPVHHLDFETFMAAVPPYAGTRPYQLIPSQWSNHIERVPGDLVHYEYLSIEPRDTREELVRALLDSLGDEGSICVYSAYEQVVLEQLAETVPALRRELKRVITRLWDLYEVVKTHYYHPSFNGSYSIKTVLPAMVPDLNYQDLEIKDGAAAARAYYRMVFEETDWVERERLRLALLKYCARDTLAMVQLRRALQKGNQSTETVSR
jgi:predicted RecB family nuclease